MRNRTSISWICLAVIIVLAALSLQAMIQMDPKNLSDLWEIGNAWMRLLGCLLGILLFMMLTSLFMTIYRYSNSKVKNCFAGLIIGNVLVILAVLAIIYSGAARLDSEFNPIQKAEAVDIEVESFDKETESVKADHVDHKGEGAKFISSSFSKYGNYINVYAQIENYEDVILDSDCLTYSLVTTSGSVYTGSFDVEVKLDYLSREGRHVINYKINYPTESGPYTVELFYRYLDGTGELHEVNDFTKEVF